MRLLNIGGSVVFWAFCLASKSVAPCSEVATKTPTFHTAVRSLSPAYQRRHQPERRWTSSDK